MPRYFFDLMDHECVFDDVGTELADDRTARVEAIHFGARYLDDHPELIWDGHEIRVHVVKERRATLYVVMILGIDMARPLPKPHAADND
ncbi:MAG: hypothetical protein INR64_03900 [Caulobacteraceae bacterium]|nr:hypothetical protein [Caulobacter sp.]